jgi:putative ABC transport system permease protein
MKMNTGIKKMLRDLTLYKGRTLLALIGILIGITSVGAVLSAYSILDREMNKSFMDTNPASMVIYASNLDDNAARLISRSFNNLDIEFRKTVQARISRGDGTYGTIYLRAIPDFGNRKVDTFSLEKGRFPETSSEMAIEKDCLKILLNIGQGVGINVQVKLPGGLEKDMRLSGVVHAPGLSPASMENCSYAFLSLGGLKNLGYTGWYDEIRIVSNNDRFDRVKMKNLSQDISAILNKNGYPVSRMDVPVPGKHPHAGQLSSLLFLLQAFALISLLAACLIIINLMNFIMSRQIRQIAVMKAVGARTYQIALPYLLYVFIISITALVISFPLSLEAGRGYSNFAADILNFKISSYRAPFWVLLIQALVAILVPLASTAYPVCRNCKIKVKEGLFEGTKSMAPREKKIMHLKKLPVFFNTRLLLPFNNLFRKKARTLIAILALLTGGVLYMTSQNIVASIGKTVDTCMQEFRWDYSVMLSGNYPSDRLDKTLLKIDGLNGYEVWRECRAFFAEDGNANSVNCQLHVIPEKSGMVVPTILDSLGAMKGKNTIVVNNGLVKEEGWIEAGMTVKAIINGKSADLVVEKIVNEVPAVPTAYMGAEIFERLFGGKTGQMILAAASTRDILEQRKITKAIEAGFKADGVEIIENRNIYVLRESFVDHLFIIVTFLTAMSMLAVIVGGVGIGTAIGINISERKREIGVLRAVGVTVHQLVVMVLVEVSLMGIISWIVGTVLSYPISKWVGNYFGQIFLGMNLQNAMSLPGSMQWLVLSAIVSIAAGFLPAWNASSSSLREMLAYE